MKRIKRKTDMGVNKGPFAKPNGKRKDVQTRKVISDANQPQRTLLGLCWRCEHRARFYETGEKPRMECGDVKTAKCGCYMYAPTRPYVVRAALNETRPIFAMPMLSGRVEPVKVAEDDLVVAMGTMMGRTVLVTWEQRSRYSICGRCTGKKGSSRCAACGPEKEWQAYAPREK